MPIYDDVSTSPKQNGKKDKQWVFLMKQKKQAIKMEIVGEYLLSPLVLMFKWTLFIYLFFKFYFIFKLYIIVLVLPNIRMNPPQVYMCSPSWTLLPPHPIPLGHPSALAPSIQYCASNLDWQLVSYMIFYIYIIK